MVKAIPVVTGLGQTADLTDTDTLTLEWATAGAVAFTGGTFHVAVSIRHKAQKAA